MKKNIEKNTIKTLTFGTNEWIQATKAMEITAYIESDNILLPGSESDSLFTSKVSLLELSDTSTDPISKGESWK